eukprot:2352083-Heterocapsa_arctica.AAC.1
MPERGPPFSRLHLLLLLLPATPDRDTAAAARFARGYRTRRIIRSELEPLATSWRSPAGAIA